MRAVISLDLSKHSHNHGCVYIVEYGCVVLNGVSCDLIDLCLPLTTNNGLLILTAPTSNISYARTKVSDAFALCQQIDIEGSSVIFGCNRELKPSGDQFKKITESVKAKLNSQKDNSVNTSNDWEFGDSLSNLTLATETT